MEKQDQKNNNIFHERADKELAVAYSEYAKMTITERALPDARDGLKNVQRRVLTTMWWNGPHRTDKHRKCAKITGQVTGDLHPHGTAPVYEAMVRMAQSFSLNHPFIDGQGNFGSIDGYPAAAERYTEARLTQYSHEFFIKDFEKICPMRPNYDGTLMEPEILPTKIPNLLVNGCQGIAVGVATSIPPHNMSEILNAFLAYIKNPEITIEEILQYIKGPDFPTRGVLSERTSFKQIYSTGEGSCVLSGAYKEEKNRIIFYEIPYQANKSELVKKMVEEVHNGRIEGVRYVRDESDRHGTRIVVELKANAQKEITINQIYNYTPMRTVINFCLFALDANKNPKIYNIFSYFKEFLEFREWILTNKLTYELSKLKQRMHILIGLSVALDNIDIVTDIVKQSSSTQEAILALRSQKWKYEKTREFLSVMGITREEFYELSEEQAKAILDLKLQHLVRLEAGKIEQETREIKANIEYCNKVLGSREEKVKIIEEETRKILERYDQPRRTIVGKDFAKETRKELTAAEDVMVIINDNKYIKRINLNSYKVQNRGGKGRNSGVGGIQASLVGNTHDKLIFFMSSGIAYCTDLYEIPQGDLSEKGRAIVNLLDLRDKDKETVIKMVVVKDEVMKESDKWSFMFVYEDGKVRRNALDHFTNIRSNGKIYANNSEKLTTVLICKEEDKIYIATEQGLLSASHVKDFRIINSRTASGVIGCKFKKKGDKVIDAIKVSDDNSLMLTVTSKGFGKISKASDYRITNRGGKGVANLKENDKTGKVVGVAEISQEDDIVILTQNGKSIRINASDLRVLGRNTMGSRLCDLDNDVVLSIERVSNINE